MVFIWSLIVISKFGSILKATDRDLVRNVLFVILAGYQRRLEALIFSHVTCGLSMALKYKVYGKS